MATENISTVIFDLGGVLVDWNPEYLYSKVFDKNKMNWFLSTVCTQAWNVEQDAGRSFEEGCSMLAQKYPDYHREIWMFIERWDEMIKKEIEGTVLILKSLHEINKVKLYALTNWSAETFPIAQQRFDFMKLFKGIVVSGEEKTRKPFDEIYQITIDRYGLHPENCLFIDDSIDNINAAKRLGINVVHFSHPDQLKNDLQQLNLL